MIVREEEYPELYKRINEQNLLRQYDLLSNGIEIGLERGVEGFDKFTLWSLNHTAVANIVHFGGRYRKEPIYVGNHVPPHHKDVHNWMERFFAFVHENWTLHNHPTLMAAYALWRLNWIHPFVEGNGRTARAACYYLLCLKQGKLLTGQKIVPERIRDDRKPYYAALKEADDAWESGHFDVSALAKYLEKLLEDQLLDRGL